MNGPAVCPYCRMSYDQEGLVKVHCTGCGTPHHEDCYQENGGCTVFGCSCAPADDPKLQVSQNDLQAAAAHTSQPVAQMYATPQLPSMYGAAATPGYPYVQPVAGYGLPPKSRTSFVVLGIFLGAFGAHNFYAGYTGKAVAQLCLTILSFFYLAVISWVWAVIEICSIDKHSAGVSFS